MTMMVKPCKLGPHVSKTFNVIIMLNIMIMLRLMTTKEMLQCTVLMSVHLLFCQMHIFEPLVLYFVAVTDCHANAISSVPPERSNKCLV